jgi:hypothetical protein
MSSIQGSRRQAVRVGGIVEWMPPSTSGSRLRTPRPLSESEWAEAERVSGRVHAELHRLMESLPEHAQHASGMSRHLNVLRATCQRVVQAVGSFDGTPAMLTRLPGVEGLRQVLDGFAAAGADAGDVAAARSALASLERLITLLGGSQSKLIERLNVSGPVAGSGAHLSLGAPEHRAALHDAAVRVTGRSCEVSLAIYAFRVAPDNPDVLERALAKGLIGSLVMPGGLPMVMSSGDTLRTAHPEEGRGAARPDGQMPEEVLRPFTTDPLPLVTSRNRKGKLYQIVDPEAGMESGLIDVVTALKARHPLMDPGTGRPTLDAIWSLVTCPTRRLILDVYLHADMERMFRPSLDALLWAPDLNIAPDDRWVMRLPSGPKLQMLGRGLAASGSELYSRHAELSAYYFRHIGWDPDEFVGFRCEVLSPVWRAGYSMAMEYLGPSVGRSERE